METIYVALRGEGVSVWRPVAAERISDSKFRIAGIVPSDGEWKFQPGQVVVCTQRVLSEGVQLVAVSPASKLK
jgi:hypothetical protein